MQTIIPQLFLENPDLSLDIPYRNSVPAFPPVLSPLINGRNIRRLDNKILQSWNIYKNGFYFYHKLNPEMFQMIGVSIFAESNLQFRMDPIDLISELKDIEAVNESFIASKNGDLKHLLRFDVLVEKRSQIEIISKKINHSLNTEKIDSHITFYKSMGNIDRRYLGTLLDSESEKVREPFSNLLFHLLTSKISIIELRNYNSRTRSREKKILQTKITSLLSAIDTFYVSNVMILIITVEDNNERRYRVEKLIKDDAVYNRIILTENQFIGMINIFLECQNADDMFATINYLREHYLDLRPVFSTWTKRSVNDDFIGNLLDKRIKLG